MKFKDDEVKEEKESMASDDYGDLDGDEDGDEGGGDCDDHK